MAGKTKAKGAGKPLKKSVSKSGKKPGRPSATKSKNAAKLIAATP